MSSWAPNADGTGISPASFGTNNIWVIQNGHFMTLSSSNSWNAGSSGVLRIESGGTLTNSSSGTLAAGIFKIYGGGTYIHNTTSVTSSPNYQFANSTNGGNGNGNVIIQNHTTSSGLPASVYGNLTIDYSLSSNWNLSGSLTQVDGDFTLNSTSSTAAVRLTGTGTSSYTLTVGGNFIITSGLLQFNNANPGSATFTLNIGGNYTQSGGILDPNVSTSTLAINFTGTNKTFNHSAGTLTNGSINWKVSSGSSLSLLVTYL